MDKERQKGRIAIKKRDLVLGLSLAAFLSVGLKEADSSAAESNPYSAYPSENFKPVVIFEETPSTDEIIIPYSNIDAEKQYVRERVVATQSPEVVETKEQKDKKELDNVILLMKENRNLFSRKYIRDVRMYYPIYKAIAEKFNMDWYLIWIVHEKETGASAGKRGFAEDSYYIGAMQRDPNIWTEDFVDKAAKGLEELKDLPQRHKDDWREIAAGARILDRNIDIRDDMNKDKAVLKSLLLYSAEGPALERYDMYLEYKEVFS
jgi:hypothetical protein